MSSSAVPNFAPAARLFHALSDENRLRVVDLVRRGERCVCELAEALDLAQPRLSFHLKTLKDAGILRDRREGRWVYYSLNHEVLEDAGIRLRNLAHGEARALRGICCG